MGDFSYTFGVADDLGDGHYSTTTYSTEHGLDPAYSASHNASVTAWVADNGTRGGRTWSKWRVCSECGLEFPETELVEYQGKWYCPEDFEGVEAQDLQLEYESWEDGGN